MTPQNGNSVLYDFYHLSGIVIDVKALANIVAVTIPIISNILLFFLFAFFVTIENAVATQKSVEKVVFDDTIACRSLFI